MMADIVRRCGDCQLCCTLLPVREVEKGHNQRCVHQRFGKGCVIYPRRPMACRLWSCQWLVEPGLRDLRRPDRAGYVIDMMPDFVTIPREDGSRPTQPVVQIWCDPRRPDAHRDPALRAWLETIAPERLGLVRRDGRNALLLVPPSMGDGVWHELVSTAKEQQHTPQQIMAAIGAE